MTKTIPGARLRLSIPPAWAKGGVIVAHLGLERIQCLNADVCEMEIRVDGQEMAPDFNQALVSGGSNVQFHQFLERYAVVPAGAHTVEATITVGNPTNTVQVTGWILDVTLSRAR